MPPGAQLTDVEAGARLHIHTLALSPSCQTIRVPIKKHQAGVSYKGICKIHTLALVKLTLIYRGAKGLIAG